MSDEDLKLAWAEFWEIQARERICGHDQRRVEWFRKYGERLLKEVERLKEENGFLQDRLDIVKIDLMLKGGTDD